MCRLRLWRLCDLRALEREEGVQFPAVDLIESFQNEHGLIIIIVIIITIIIINIITIYNINKHDIITVYDFKLYMI